MSAQHAIALPLAPNESARLEELAAYRVAGTWPETQFDEITQLVRTMFGVPMAIVSLLDRDTQWIKSSAGIATRHMPRDISFCTHTIMGDAPLVIPDARQDARFKANPLVTADPNIRFYAGAPLITKAGFRLGALCVIDDKPRPAPDPRQLMLLANFAGLVVTQLELRLDRLPT